MQDFSHCSDIPHIQVSHSCSMWNFWISCLKSMQDMVIIFFVCLQRLICKGRGGGFLEGEVDIKRLVGLGSGRIRADAARNTSSALPGPCKCQSSFSRHTLLLLHRSSIFLFFPDYLKLSPSSPCFKLRQELFSCLVSISEKWDDHQRNLKISYSSDWDW